MVRKFKLLWVEDSRAWAELFTNTSMNTNMYMQMNLQIYLYMKIAMGMGMGMMAYIDMNMDMNMNMNMCMDINLNININMKISRFIASKLDFDRIIASSIQNQGLGCKISLSLQNLRTRTNLSLHRFRGLKFQRKLIDSSLQISTAKLSHRFNRLNFWWSLPITGYIHTVYSRIPSPWIFSGANANL